MKKQASPKVERASVDTPAIENVGMKVHISRGEMQGTSAWCLVTEWRTQGGDDKDKFIKTQRNLEPRAWGIQTI